MTEGFGTYAIDVDETFTESRTGPARWQSAIDWGYRQANVLLMCAAVAAMFIIAVRWKSARLDQQMWAVTILLATAVALRVTLFALIDASSYFADELRYVYPVSHVATSLALLLIVEAHRLLVPRRATEDVPTGIAQNPA
jgi:hypothetical protein